MVSQPMSSYHLWLLVTMFQKCHLISSYGILSIPKGSSGQNMAFYDFLKVLLAPKWLSMDSFTPNMPFYGFLWSDNGFVSLLLVSYGFLWLPLGSYGPKWLPMTSCEFLRPHFVFLSSHYCCLWFPLDLYHFIWIGVCWLTFSCDSYWC